METRYTILRVRKQTAAQLKILAALQGTSIVEWLDQFVAEAYQNSPHLKKESQTDDPC